MRRWLAVVSVLPTIALAGCYDANDAEDACAAHKGVQSLQDTTWTTEHDALVICKDGTAEDIN